MDALRPTQLTAPAARKFLARFEALGLVEEGEGNRWGYQTPSADLEGVVAALTKAYNERPVTLVRTIYSLRDSKLRSLADAFRLKKE